MNPLWSFRTSGGQNTFTSFHHWLKTFSSPRGACYTIQWAFAPFRRIRKILTVDSKTSLESTFLKMYLGRNCVIFVISSHPAKMATSTKRELHVGRCRPAGHMTRRIFPSPGCVVENGSSDRHTDGWSVGLTPRWGDWLKSLATASRCSCWNRRWSSCPG